MLRRSHVSVAPPEAGSGPSPHGLEAADEQETAGGHATRANETMVMGLCGVTDVYMV